MSLQLKLAVSYNDFFGLLKCELKKIKHASDRDDFSDRFYDERRTILNKTPRNEFAIQAAKIDSTNELINTIVGQTITLEQTSPLTSDLIIWNMVEQWTWNVLLLEVFAGLELVDFQQYFRKFYQLYLKSQ